MFDFSKEENARSMRAAIEKVRGELGREYDLVIGGKRIKTADKIRSLNPAKPSRGRGRSPEGRQRPRRARHASRAQGLPAWSRTTVEERAVASLPRRRPDARAQDGILAWLVFEVSKNWAEADADIAETIDFCEFYAREALRFAKAETPIQLPGERDTPASTFRSASAP